MFGMEVDVLYVDITTTAGSMGKIEIVRYGVVNERQTTRADVAILRRVPPTGYVSIPDLERGYTEATIVPRNILLLSGYLTQSSTPVYVIDAPTLKKEIPAWKVADAVKKVVDEISEQKRSIADIDTEVDGLSLKLTRIKPASTIDEITDTLLTLYFRIAGRKRVFMKTAVLVKMVLPDGKEEWCVTTLPRILPYLWEAPRELQYAGILDPGGFELPFLYVNSIVWKDFPPVERIFDATRWIIGTIAQTGVGTGAGARLKEEQARPVAMGEGGDQSSL